MEAIVTQMVIGVLSGLGAAYLSLTQFRAQRIWEDKEKGYREILDALHEMSKVNDIWLNWEMHWGNSSRQPSDERREDLDTRYTKASAIIAKYAEYGAVTISPKVEAALVTLRKKLEENADSDEGQYLRLDSDGFAIVTALRQVKRAATSDRRFLLSRWIFPHDITAQRDEKEQAMNWNRGLLRVWVSFGTEQSVMNLGARWETIRR